MTSLNACSNIHKLSPALFCLLIFLNCNIAARKPDPAHVEEVENWHKRRIEKLRRPDGWLSLAGLYWLKNGENTFGTDPTNDLVFPEGKAPGSMGSFFLKDGTVTVRINPALRLLLSSQRHVQHKCSSTSIYGAHESFLVLAYTHD